MFRGGENALYGDVASAQRLFGNISPNVVNAEQINYAYKMQDLEKTSPGADFINKFAYNLGNMTVANNPAHLFISAGGNSYSNAKAEGKTETQALTYALTNASTEVLLRKVVGKTVGGIARYSGTTSILKNTINNAVKNPAAKSALKYLSNTSGEMLDEYTQAVMDPMIRNSIFKEDNKFTLAPEGWLDTILIAGLTATVMNASSNVNGLNSDVMSMIYKMKNSNGEYLSNQTIKGYFSGSPTEEHLQEMSEWGKGLKAEDIDTMINDLTRIASVKIGGIAYGDISKTTSKMDSGKAIEFYHKIMSSPEYKAETEEIKKHSAAAWDNSEGGEFGGRGEEDLVGQQKATDNNLNTDKQNNISLSEENIANGDEMGYKGGILKTTSELLKKSTCTTNELANYLRLVDITGETDYANNYLKDGIWPDIIQIPKSSDVLNANGEIDWAQTPENGYVLDEAGNAIKEKLIPKIGDIVDRFGPPNGRFVSPVVNGKSYTYEQRDLPFIEDIRQYHKYKVIGDFTKLKEYISNCDDIQLKSQINAFITMHYDGDYEQAITFEGEIAGTKGWGSGGGMQNEYPIIVKWLEKIRLLDEIK